jgi:hypothetical protein
MSPIVRAFLSTTRIRLAALVGRGFEIIIGTVAGASGMDTGTDSDADATLDAAELRFSSS